jgi:hypothetical protein
MLKADDAHLVNLRIQKTLTFPGTAASSSAATCSTCSTTARRPTSCRPTSGSSLFAQPTNYVPARVAQLGIRMTF